MDFPAQWRMYSLFGYETQGGRNSILWYTPMYFSERIGQGGKELDEALAAWLRTKRAFTRDEILTGLWKKIGDHGYTLIMRFLPDGTFIEHLVTSEDAVVHGIWELGEGGHVTTRVEQREQGSLATYELDLVASRTGSTHSGLETRNTERNAYFKVIHLV